MEGSVAAPTGMMINMLPPRPTGISSRLHTAPGPRYAWTAPNGQSVSLPVTLDIIDVKPDGTVAWSVEAVVDLIGEAPKVTSISISSTQGLDLARLQQKFRWATPLEVVTRMVPALL
ncbi:MAG: hypothetical protein WBZ04_01740, partial [Candidatus Nanopelagicales bacterium]